MKRSRHTCHLGSFCSWPIKLLLLSTLISSLVIPINTASARNPSGTFQPAQKRTPGQATIEGTAIVIKVVAVKDNAVAASEFTKPKAGNKFVSIQIVVDNTKGTDEWALEPDKFKLKDDEGNVYEKGYTMSEITQPTLKSGSVDGSDLVKGWISYEVGTTVSIKSLKIRYEDSDSKSAWIPLSDMVK